MSDPERLELELGSGFEQSLIRAAREVRAPASARQRALQASLGALAAGGATLVASHAVAGTKALIAKPLLIGALAGALLAGGGVAIEKLSADRSLSRTSSTQPAPRDWASPAATGASPSEPPLAASSVEPSARALSAPPSSAKLASSESANAESLRFEVAALDRARSALARGDARGALAALDRHAAEFRRPALGPEATVLRIEALARSGQRGSAAELARRFVTAHPSGPLAERARRYLPESER